MRRRSSEYDQSGMVNVSIRHRPEAAIWIIICRRRIGQEHDPVIAEHRIARRRMTAVLGGRSRNDDRIDTPLT